MSRNPRITKIKAVQRFGIVTDKTPQNKLQTLKLAYDFFVRKGLKNALMQIDHFRISLNFFFKASLGAHPFI